PMFRAADADLYFARLTARRMAVHDAPLAAVDVAVAGELPEEWGDLDVLVSQVPYAPSESRAAEQVVDTIDDIALRLALGSSAVVVGPADVLVRELQPYSPAERARARLLSSGVVEAVILLPGGLLPFRPGYEVAVWVLTAP